MRQHCENAMRLAQFLAVHPEVERVYYPGLPDSPDHALARKQMSAFGGMISAELRGGAERNLRFVSKTKLFALAESLGGVEAVVGYPLARTHAALHVGQRR